MAEPAGTEAPPGAGTSATGPNFRSGFVAVIGRPNVGKSTLVNRLLGRKLAITSRRAQTTRHRLLGIRTTDDAQYVYVDTPGIHLGSQRALNRYLNRTALGAIEGVDVVVLVVEALRWTAEDDTAAARAAQAAPVLLAVNKIDRVRPRDRLLPFLEECAARCPAAEIVPVSAIRGENVERLEALVRDRLPPGEMLYPPDQYTDRGEQFLVAELVREKLTERLGDELPYRLAVTTEHFAPDADDVLQIGTVVWVERPGQKGIAIGKDGQLLKAVGTDARRDIEALLGRHVFLSIRVRIRKGWSNDERALRTLGYTD